MPTDTAPLVGVSPIPTPGSAAALHLGCRCPVVANHFGKGRRQHADGRPPEFAMPDDCPIHGPWYKETCNAA